MMKALLAIVAFAVLTVAAHAQSTLLQAGPITPGHAPMYVNSGTSQAVVQDGGTAAGGVAGATLSEMGITVRGTGTPPYANQGKGPFGANFCDYDAPITNPTGYHYLCLSPNAQGGGLFAYGNGGTASQLPFNFIINGVPYSFPFSIGGIIGPATTTVGHLAVWANSVGTLLGDAAQITTAQLPLIGTNTVIGNATSGTTTASAQSMPSCSTSASALAWTTNTGFGCNTSIAANTANSATTATTASSVSAIPANDVYANATNASASPTGIATGQILAGGYGINGNGSTDNCTAVTAINTAITSTTTTVVLPPGIYSLACNITLLGTWQFTQGAMLKPANGFTVNFAHMYVAGTYQIFDLYDPVTGTPFGGAITLPAAGTTDVWGEQFGMVGDFVTIHNEVGMQEAINALYPVSLAENGGFIRLGTGTFQMCGSYTVPNSIAIQGMGRGSTEILANATCWNGNPNMVVSVDYGSISQFGCWHRDLNLNANSIAAITSVINAGSWQEDSGVERVLINNFMQNGIIDTGFFGGSADFNVYDTELFWSASATGQVAGILMEAGDVQNWTNVNLRTVTFAGASNTIPTNDVYGFLLYGRLNVNVQAIHCENVKVCFSLNDEATLGGAGVNGGPGTGTVVSIDPFTNGATGTKNTGTPPHMSLVSLDNFELGGASTLFTDNVNTVTIADQFGQPFIYPAVTFTGSPTSSFSTRSGVVTHQ